MNIPSIDEMLEWIDGTTAIGETSAQTKARFQKVFGAGTPPVFLDQIEKNLDAALLARAARKQSERS